MNGKRSLCLCNGITQIAQISLAQPLANGLAKVGCSLAIRWANLYAQHLCWENVGPTLANEHNLSPTIKGWRKVVLVASVGQRWAYIFPT